jgi:hypothetical protein
MSRTLSMQKIFFFTNSYQCREYGVSDDRYSCGFTFLADVQHWQSSWHAFFTLEIHICWFVNKHICGCVKKCICWVVIHLVDVSRKKKTSSFLLFFLVKKCICWFVIHLVDVSRRTAKNHQSNTSVLHNLYC